MLRTVSRFDMNPGVFETRGHVVSGVIIRAPRRFMSVMVLHRQAQGARSGTSTFEV